MFCPICESYADIEGFTEKYNSNNPNYKKSNLICKNGHTFCSCGRPLHDGNCYHDDNNFQKFLEKEKIKQCPKCGFLIKKNEGCNHMICGNPICKYEFCWLCMKESIPDHYKYGPCAGLQFIDPDSFMFKLKKNNSFLYNVIGCFNCLFWLMIIILCVFIIPGLSFIFLAYQVLYRNIPRKKILTFLHFMSISFIFLSIQSILYMVEISLFSVLLITIAFKIFCKIIVFIFWIFTCCCIRTDRHNKIEMVSEAEMEIINDENINNNNNERI